MRCPLDDQSPPPTVPPKPTKCVWCNQAVEKGRRLSIGEEGREFWIHDACWDPYRSMMEGGG